MSNRAKVVIFAMILAATTFAAAEVALRVFHYFRSGTSPFAFLPQYREKRYQLSPFLVFGPRLNWQVPGKKDPANAYFNDQGFRTRGRLGPKPPSEFRIITLGGSTTEDLWNQDGLHWPLWLERELHRRGHGQVRVYNAAMSAYSSAHTLIRLAFDVLDYQPDAVVVMHNVNDLTVNYYAVAAGRPADGHYLVKYGLKALTADLTEEDVIVSRLLHSLRRRLGKAESRFVMPTDYDISAGLGAFRRNLENIDALVRNRGGRLVLLTMPMNSSEDAYRVIQAFPQQDLVGPLPEFKFFRRDFADYNRAIREVATRRGVVLVDMAELLGVDPRFFVDVVHYSSEGSRRFGELLAAQLAMSLPGLTPEIPTNRSTH